MVQGVYCHLLMLLSIQRMIHLGGGFLSNSEMHLVKDQRCVSFPIGMQALLRQFQQFMMKYLILHVCGTYCKT